MQAPYSRASFLALPQKAIILSTSTPQNMPRKPEPSTDMNGMPASPAMALASMVLPQDDKCVGAADKQENGHELEDAEDEDKGVLQDSAGHGEHDVEHDRVEPHPEQQRGDDHPQPDAADKAPQAPRPEVAPGHNI